MKTVFTIYALLFVFWLALSAQTSLLLLLLGAVSVCLVIFLSKRMRMIGSGLHTWSLYRRLPFYALRLLCSLVYANFDVAVRIVHPKLPIDPGFVRLPISPKSDIGRLIHANSITLTPGTITTGIDEETIEVHVLNRSKKLEQKLIKIDQQTGGW